MRRRAPSGSVLALCLVVGALLASAATSACGRESGRAVSSSAAANAAPTSAAAPVAVREFRGMLPVVSTDRVFDNGAYRRVATSGGVKRMRQATWKAVQKSSDPRLSGTHVVMINVDQRQADMSSTLWGTGVVRNAGGTWAGRWTGGTAAGGDVHFLNLTMRGTDGYTGLVYRATGKFVEAGEGFTPDIEIVFAGRIETTDGSPVPPAPGPGTTPADWTPVVAIDTMDRPAYEGPEPWLVDVTGSDARVGGRLEGQFDARAERSDGSADYGGAWSLTNQAGAWKSTDFSGVRGPGGVEHFQLATYSGSGAYTGLIYHEFAHFMERRNFVKGDTVISSGWIEEAE
jgi:hypothetical protein